jgi:hypothetical protein
MAWWWLPALVAAGWPALNFAIRRGLTAPRVPETADPGALPWHVVRLPAANEKHLFGWFIPATPGAPALVVLHDWGGNAEMMLPLAAPLHAGGLRCCWSMRAAMAVRPPDRHVQPYPPVKAVALPDPPPAPFMNHHAGPSAGFAPSRNFGIARIFDQECWLTFIV